MWSEINISDTARIQRFDAEYFHPNFIIVEEQVTRFASTKLGKIAAYISRGIQPEYSEQGSVPALRTVNIREEGISDTRQQFVNLDFFEQNPKGQVKYGDILITSTGVGTLGRVTYNYEDDTFFADGHITIVRDIKELNPLY